MSLPSYSSIPNCCICGSLLIHPEGKKFTKDGHENHQTDCCHRFICGKCIDGNSRFLTYCPFCQTSSSSPNASYTALPPSYSQSAPSHSTVSPIQAPEDGLPPPYEHPQPSIHLDKLGVGVIHHLRPEDTISSLSLQYNTPPFILRSSNALFSDNLLPARRTLFIPHSDFYQGPSLCPYPHEDPETYLRKTKVKRFQLRTKCVEYQLAEWYLIESEWDEEEAVRKWESDEEWEKEHPLPLGLKEGKRGSRRKGTFSAIADEKGVAEEKVRKKVRRLALRNFGH
ncbi:hypothetical protein BDZ91DRAFT_714653 [Kalaharituber pfeilii]|nr:hypothetical protein BDZ91DRAFT_714653 [Kalaharituber pfeilii]